MTSLDQQVDTVALQQAGDSRGIVGRNVFMNHHARLFLGLQGENERKRLNDISLKWDEQCLTQSIL